jgi:hypothetical protein
MIAAPAVRSAVMISAQTVSSRCSATTWAALAWGHSAPDQPRTAMDLGWQLSVSGFAA